MFEKSVFKMKLRVLMAAINNFSKDNIIGTGRIGTVYKATLRFPTALTLLSKGCRSQSNPKSSLYQRWQHYNIRTWLPFWAIVLPKGRCSWVYKCMPNRTLYDQLHGSASQRIIMEWPTRLKISIGGAKRIAWLHHSCNPCILHRNISSNCILLDKDYEPKISNFGLARLMNPIDTHLSTFVNGEFGDLGYVAPECACTLFATPNSEVYSFGVVLLELITGEKPTQVSKASENFNGSLVEWVAFLSNNSILPGSY